jgi:hypothetical protein
MTTPQSTGNENPAAWASGWVAFAGFMLILIGMFWGLQGLAAIIEDQFYVLGEEYAFEIDVTGWGWIHMIGGLVAVAAGCYVFTGNLAARLFGILIALVSAVANFFYIPYYPLWSILIIALNVIVIWALAVYSTEAARAKYRSE